MAEDRNGQPPEAPEPIDTPQEDREGLAQGAAAVGLGAAIGALLLRLFGRRRPEHEVVPEGEEEEEVEEREPGMRVVRRGHERRDANVRSVIWFGVSLGILLFALFIVTSLGLFSFVGAFPPIEIPPRGEEISRATPTALPPEPRLQVSGAEALQQFRATENATLSSYGWVDQAAGVARIPITRAMELTAQRGLPARSADQASGFRDQGGQSPSSSSSGRVQEPYP